MATPNNRDYPNGLRSKSLSTPNGCLQSTSNSISKFSYEFIKGRIAETLIRELFLCSGYNVFHYGMEYTIPGIMELLPSIDSDAARSIRQMPDFVVQSKETGDVHFVEVKFRANGMFPGNKNFKDYAYKNAFIIVVSRKHIKCITVAELKDGKTITPETNNYLAFRKEFNLSPKLVVDFCKVAGKFFELV